jgi:hypothetical protein
MFFINGQLLLLSKDYSISGTILTIHSNRPAPSLYDNLRMFAGIGNLIGSQGTQGDQGTNGTIGVDGAQGYQGTQGYQGIGVQGYQGHQGDQGASGSSDWTRSGNNIYNNNTGKVLIGTSVDNTTNKLQVNGSGIFTGSSLTGQTILKVIGSGSASTLPIFVVEGSQGELFSVSDSLTGSLFSVNDISGLPVLEAFSDNTILMGSYSAPSLNTTVRISAPVGSTDIYSIPIATYTGAFFDYTINDGTNLRAGSIMSIWNGSTIQYTETSTSSIGSTAGLTFNMVVSGSSAILKTTVTSGTWIVKIIVRSI